VNPASPTDLVTRDALPLPVRLWPLAGWGLFLLAAFPSCRWYFHRISDQSDEPLGLLALLVFTGLVWTRRQEIEWRPTLLIRGSGLLLAWTWAGNSAYPMVMAAGVLAVLLSSMQLREGRSGLAALLLLSLPLMASLDFYAGSPMRLAAAEMARVTLSTIGLPVTRAGTLLMDGDRIVGVDPPCSGVRMLWTTWFVAATLASLRRLRLPGTLALLVVATFLVTAGNGLRATLLYFPESGPTPWPHMAHEGVGLACQALVLAGVYLVAGQASGANRVPPTHRNFTWMAATAPFLVALGLLWHFLPSERSQSNTFVWPATWDGVPLHSVPLSERESRFAQSFPGQVGRFQCGEAEVILRHVTQATRLLHSSADCLRASGYEIRSQPAWQDIDGRVWGCYEARHRGQSYRVRERITNSSQSQCHTDVSSWYWSAFWNPETGPWLAMTVIETIPSR
jgi:exosortase/archaeosortase family protein